MAMEPLERRLDLGGISLSVREWPGAEPALLCLHGLASNARWWDPVARFLAPEHRLVAVDLRGHGLSDRPERGYGFSEVAGDLSRLRRELDLARPVLVGHSWGASVALWLAAQEPGIRAVVGVDGGASDPRRFFGDSWELAEERMRPPALTGIDPSRLRGFIAGSGFAEEVGEEEALRVLMGNFEDDPEGGIRPRLDLRRHMEIARALFDLDQPALWARVRCPVLFLVAVDDPGMAAGKRESVERAAAILGGPSETVFLEGIHDLPVQHPAAVADAISGFLERQGAQA